MGLSLWLKLGTVKIQFLEDRHGQILPNLSVFISPDDFPFLSLSRCLPVGRPSHLGCQDKRHEKLLERLSPESNDVEHLRWGHDWPLCCKLSINHLDNDYRSDLTPQHLSTLATDVPLFLQIFFIAGFCLSSFNLLLFFLWSATLSNIGRSTMAKRFCSTFLLPSFVPFLMLPAMMFLHLPAAVKGDCWLIEGDKGYVWLAICSQNQPPYETIPQHINSTVSTSPSTHRAFVSP